MYNSRQKKCQLRFHFCHCHNFITSFACILFSCKYTEVGQEPAIMFCFHTVYDFSLYQKNNSNKYIKCCLFEKILTFYIKLLSSLTFFTHSSNNNNSNYLTEICLST